jgi:hypothetical protein
MKTSFAVDFADMGEAALFFQAMADALARVAGKAVGAAKAAVEAVASQGDALDKLFETQGAPATPASLGEKPVRVTRKPRGEKAPETGTPAAVETPAEKPATAGAVTIDQLREAGAKVVSLVGGPAVADILKSYEATKYSAVSEAKWPELLGKLQDALKAKPDSDIPF